MQEIDNGLVNVITYSLLYALTYVFYFRKIKKSSIGKLLILLYIASSFVSIFHYSISNSYENITLFPYLYLFIAVLISVLPVIKFKNDSITEIKPPNKTRLNVFLVCIVILAILDVILYYEIYQKAIVLALADSNDTFAYIYQERIYANEVKRSLNYTNIIHVLFGSLFNLLPFFFFYYLTLQKGSKFIKWALGLSLVLPLLSTISNAGRNGLIVFFLLLISAYFLFRKLYSSSTLKYIKIIIGVFSIFILSFILTISVARFAEREGQNPVLESIISYGGQSSLNFNEYIFKAKDYEYGDNSFPLYRKFLGLDYSTSPIIRQYKWQDEMGIPLHIFYTFVGDLCLDFGPTIAILLLSILTLIFRYNIPYRNSSPKVHTLMLIYFLFNTYAQGIFYFMDKTIGGNLSILSFIFIYLLFKYYFYASNGKNTRILSSTISSNS